MESKHMKTSHSKSWECKPFTHGFLIFLLTENMEIILKRHAYCIASSSSSSNSYKCPLEIWYATLSKMEAKYMKTSV